LDRETVQYWMEKILDEQEEEERIILKCILLKPK
jgi:hypothetical protein